MFFCHAENTFADFILELKIYSPTGPNRHSTCFSRPFGWDFNMRNRVSMGYLPLFVKTGSNMSLAPGTQNPSFSVAYPKPATTSWRRLARQTRPWA